MGKFRLQKRFLYNIRVGENAIFSFFGNLIFPTLRRTLQEVL